MLPLENKKNPRHQLNRHPATYTPIEHSGLVTAANYNVVLGIIHVGSLMETEAVVIFLVLVLCAESKNRRMKRSTHAL